MQRSMDKTRFSKRRLIENELVLRRKNKIAKDAIKKFYDAVDIDNEALEFYCECSNDDCEDRIKTTIENYETEHQRKDRFVVLLGHETDDIERVVHKYHDYSVVQKFDLPK